MFHFQENPIFWISNLASMGKPALKSCKRKRKRDTDFYIISGTGEIVKAGDFVLMKSSEHDRRRSVALVKKLETDMEGNITVNVRRYYWPEETSFKRRIFHGAKELLLTDKYETQSANRIVRKCIVHSFKDYIKLGNIGAMDYYSRFEYKVGTHELTPDSVPVYCKCEMPCNPDEIMGQCDDCEQWFHPGCVKMTTEQAQHLSKFLCDECSS